MVRADPARDRRQVRCSASFARAAPCGLALAAALLRTTGAAALGDWLPGLNATHFWDCNGGGCDSRTLQPWNEQKYIYAPQFAPTDPRDHGGAVYGERLWLTGAASDALSPLLGGDQGCCGSDVDGGGGCGRCLLVRNPRAVNSDWTAVVMKKSRCPPWSNGCEEPYVHMDIAVPGYDNLQYSTANICGNRSARVDTFMTRDQSGVCGAWYKRGPNTAVACECDFPADTPELQILKRGCELFSAWGWTTGDPALEYQAVACPKAFEALVGGAFGPEGVLPPPASWWPWIVGGVIGGILLLVLCLVLLIFQRQAAQAEAEEEARMKERRRQQRQRLKSGVEGGGSSSSESETE